MNAILSKSRAAGIHLIFNLAIFSILLFILLKLWYPPPFFSASGGLQGLKIVALVDIVLGPILTFVIFNQAKAKHLLKMDITLIFVLQIAAFTWGIWAIYQQRPLAITYWHDGFYSVPASELKSQPNALEILAQYGDSFPVFAYVDRRLDAEGHQRIMQAVAKHKDMPPYQILSLYENHKDFFDKILAYELDDEKLEYWMQRYPKAQKQLDKVVQGSGIAVQDLHFVWLISRYRNPLICLLYTSPSPRD